MVYVLGAVTIAVDHQALTLTRAGRPAERVPIAWIKNFYVEARERRGALHDAMLLIAVEQAGRRRHLEAPVRAGEPQFGALHEALCEVCPGASLQRLHADQARERLGLPEQGRAWAIGFKLAIAGAVIFLLSRFFVK